MKDKDLTDVHRAAQENRGLTGICLVRHAQLVENAFRFEGGMRPVDDDPHRPLAGVFGQADHRLIEIGIQQARHGHQTLASQGFGIIRHTSPHRRFENSLMHQPIRGTEKVVKHQARGSYAGPLRHVALEGHGLAIINRRHGIAKSGPH